LVISTEISDEASKCNNQLNVTEQQKNKKIEITQFDNKLTKRN